MPILENESFLTVGQQRQFWDHVLAAHDILFDELVKKYSEQEYKTNEAKVSKLAFVF
jgi:hypothetical protein